MRIENVVTLKDGHTNSTQLPYQVSNFPVSNVSETKDTLMIVLEVPGFDYDDIAVHAMQSRLFVSGSRKENYFNKSRLFIKTERIASFRWVYDTRFLFTRKNMTIELDNGFLIITLQKDEPALRGTAEKLNATDFVTENVYYPRANVVETEHHYEMSLELPGYRQSDITIQTSGTILTIKGKRLLNLFNKEYQYLRIEIPFRNSFARRFEMPENVNQNQMSWRIQNGLLLVYLPKLKAITESEVSHHALENA